MSTYEIIEIIFDILTFFASYISMIVGLLLIIINKISDEKK